MRSFVRKLRHGARLTQDDEKTLLGLLPAIRRIDARGDIVLQGSPLRSPTIVLEGWACSYKQLENGKRQIISFLLPGDLCNPFVTLPSCLDHSIGALTPVTLAHVSQDALRTATQNSSGIEKALWWNLLVAAAIEREHVVSLGRRSASERLGHLFCELHLRFSMVGLLDGLGYEFPITQTDLADLLGLSPVHVNRSLQELRSSRMISLHDRRLVIRDLDGLRAASYFDPAYLRLESAASG